MTGGASTLNGGAGVLAASSGTTDKTGAYTAVAGPNSLTVSMSNAGAYAWSSTPGAVSISQTGYDFAQPAVLSGGTLAFGNVHAGAAAAVALALGNTVKSNSAYQDSLNGTVVDNSGLFAANSFSSLAAGNSSSLTFTAASGTAGLLSSLAVSFTSNANGVLGLSDSTLGSTTISVTGQVYSGQMVWSGSSNGDNKWGTGGNWTDSLSNQVHAAPGLDAKFANVDTATFDTTGSGGTVTLNDAAPSLAAITFSNSGGASYTLTGGAITLNGGASAAAVLATGSGTQTIAASLVLSPTAVASFRQDPASVIQLGGSGATIGSTDTSSGTLSLDGPGELVLLPNTVNTTAATIVSQGTLDVQDGEAIADGSSLTVGDASLFAPSVALNNHAGAARS